MIQRIIFAVALSATFLTACQNAPKVAEKVAAAAPDASKQIGEPITAEGAVSYDEMLQKLGTSDSLAIKVTGKVESVCQIKGCWMNIVSATAGKDTMFVQFKDYGFFMPKDLAGAQVTMQGYAYREATSVEELRHYAEDEHQSKAEIEAITQPKVELKFMASGVLLQ